jgi:L-amino acid N-acyltransferase YncA
VQCTLRRSIGDGMSVTIVDADESHLPGVVAIFNHAVRETFAIWSETETTVALRRQWMQARKAAGFPILAAIDEAGGVLGYGSFGVFRDFPGYARTVEHSVYIAPAAQRRGIGRAILDELIARAATMGLDAMVGGIDSANTPSITLHEKAGFEIQGVLKGVGRKFGKKLDLVFMVKAL